MGPGGVKWQAFGVRLCSAALDFPFDVDHLLQRYLVLWRMDETPIGSQQVRVLSLTGGDFFGVNRAELGP